jgi:hypothetical protein
MFLSFVPGIFDDWNHPREIVHLTSADGVKWEAIGPGGPEVRQGD